MNRKTPQIQLPAVSKHAPIDLSFGSKFFVNTSSKHSGPKVNTTEQ